ncbi:di-heme oxidoredictase family protein [Algicella marina]|uniref:C-type cytochrome n=1 Tax=Algicella marina TaxID=2683284 RepID=A0A6P1T6F0_9RHOB|nr:di-heme oxidoredictase family protein [Algicella marina]QHQ37335.1 c-type cytochrome [Algicella marina]
MIIAASVTHADVLFEPHLPIVPRTADEMQRVTSVTRPATDFNRAQKFEERSAGAATVYTKADANAFSHPSANLTFEQELDFKVGNGLFRKIWVSAPSSTLASDGLGPLYNARSCQRCHIKDGRGHPPEADDSNAISMLTKVAVPIVGDDAMAEIEAYIATAPEPTYGSQLQDLSIAGLPSEYRLNVSYEERPVELSGGEVVSLRVPSYTPTDLAYGPLATEAMLSPRVTPQMIGLGLLEAVPAADILAWEDPQDANNDGVSGRANIVFSQVYGAPMLGRFGWKAAAPTIREQSAAAFSNDIGISTRLHPSGWGDCTTAQIDCQSAIHGDGDDRIFEADDLALDLVSFYSRNLGVPARRDVDTPSVLRGKKVFHEAHCATCHRPSFVTHRLEGHLPQSFQLIWPYTDMLLHDMGPGLADGFAEARAMGQEWRTPPLWGIGLTEAVSGHTYFLHDGRARNLVEAILWHGGEAQDARDTFVSLPKVDRDTLIVFLESL